MIDSHVPYTPAAEIDEASITAFVGGAQRLEAALQRIIIGQEAVIRETLIALLAGGNALLEGVPGLGKTLLIRTLAAGLRLSFSRIQFTPDLMPADITGTTILHEDESGRRSFAFQPGPLFAHLVLADEINRATPKTQSALLEAMQERTVSVGRETHLLPSPFFVLATQNPLEMEGTYPLPEAQLDRFLLKILVPFPTEGVLQAIVHQTLRPPEPISPVLGPEQLGDMLQVARAVPVATAVIGYAVSLVVATQPDRFPAAEGRGHNLVQRFVHAGVSPRGLQALVSCAQVNALLEGRFNVSTDDIRRLAHPVMRHRILLSFAGQAEGLTPDAIVDEILAKIPLP
jgi:MoxR-like ATPase